MQAKREDINIVKTKQQQQRAEEEKKTSVN